MNLYLDDDTADRRLVAMLQHARHAVTIPVDVQLTGAPDAHHFILAMHRSLVLITRNHDDFLDLHEVVQAGQLLLGLRRLSPSHPRQPRTSSSHW
jgi:hypothetical protein